MVVNPVVSDFRTQGFINIRAVNVTSCLLVVLIVFGNDILLVINIISDFLMWAVFSRVILEMGMALFL
jgi:hypothetical protein